MVSFIKTFIKTYIKVAIITVIVCMLMDMPMSFDNVTTMLQLDFVFTLIYRASSFGASLHKSKPSKPRKRSILGAFIGSAIRSSNRRSESFQRGMSDAIYNSFTSSSASDEAYRQQRRQADQRARDRWDAIDRQKKAEWDARDAALRGKDKAAYNYQNKADYWRNQSKKY